MIIFIFFSALGIGLTLRYHLILALIIVPLFLIFVYKKKNKWIFIASIAFILVGLLISFIHLSFPQEIYKGIIIEAKENYFILLSKGEKLYVYSYDHGFEIGDIVAIKGSKSAIDFIVLESGFDFNQYLNQKGIYYALNSQKIEIIFQSFIRLKAFTSFILKGLNDNAKNLLGSIVFNTSFDYQNEARQLASSLHLFRLISSSGIYAHFFLKIIDKILPKRLSYRRKSIIEISIFIIPTILSLFKITYLRILLLKIIQIKTDKDGKPVLSYLSALSLSGIILLFFDYHLIYQDSFILAYSLPIFIYLISPHINGKRRWLKKGKMVGIISLFFLPFSLSFNHEISLFSPFYQVIFSPIFILYIISSIPLFVFLPVQGIINFESNSIYKILSLMDRVNPKFYSPPFNEIIWALYLFVLIFCFYLHNRYPKFLKTVSFVLISILILYFVPIDNLISEQVSFINVGQGDCCLIRSGVTTCLIDTGGNVKSDIATNNLIPFLKKMRVYNIDLVITTHDDYDHSGALASLKEHFIVKKHVDSADSFPINIGNITFENYNNFNNYTDENSSSLVIGFHLVKHDFLITGDAPIPIEKAIMMEYENIPCDILKVGHHGSNTSTCEKWVSYLSPKEAIISCGKNNSYGHPHKEVLDILKKYEVVIKRTDILGTITYKNYILM